MKIFKVLDLSILEIQYEHHVVATKLLAWIVMFEIVSK